MSENKIRINNNPELEWDLDDKWMDHLISFLNERGKAASFGAAAQEKLKERFRPCECNAIPHSKECPKSAHGEDESAIRFDNGSTIKAVAADGAEPVEGVSLDLLDEIDDRSNDRFEAMDEGDVQRIVTVAVREADRSFQASGGSSRHWVRDWFLPYLRQKNLEVVRVVETVVPVEHTPSTNYLDQINAVKRGVVGDLSALDFLKEEPAPTMPNVAGAAAEFIRTKMGEPAPSFNDVTITVGMRGGGSFTLMADNIKFETTREVTKQYDDPGSKKFKLTPSRRIKTRISVTEAKIYGSPWLDKVSKDWKHIQIVKDGMDAHQESLARRKQGDEKGPRE